MRAPIFQETRLFNNAVRINQTVTQPKMGGRVKVNQLGSCSLLWNDNPSECAQAQRLPVNNNHGETSRFADEIITGQFGETIRCQTGSLWRHPVQAAPEIHFADLLSETERGKIHDTRQVTGIHDLANVLITLQQNSFS